MTEAETTELLARYSRAEISAIQLRRALGGISYGDVLTQMARHGLPLPQPVNEDSRQRIDRAREWLFPRAS